MDSIQQVHDLIRSRRAVYPHMYNEEEISDSEIWEILENANWAPTHKHTEPWRFRVFRRDARLRLADFMAESYRSSTPPALYSGIKYRKAREKVLQSACVIAICMRRDPRERLPEWEELAALACAVQNMWLTCAAMGIGAYWSTPFFISQARAFLELAEDESCYGLFYMGRTAEKGLVSSRSPIAGKVKWYNE